MWDKMTVGKYQQLYDVLQVQTFENVVDRQIALLACLDEKSVDYYEAMPFLQLQRDHLPRVAFLSNEPPAPNKPPRWLRIGWREYKVLYDFRDICAGQFIDVMSITKAPEGGNPVVHTIANLHRLMSAICLPVRFAVNGRRVMPYGFVPFDTVANDMLQAPITDVLNISGFFFDAWKAFLKDIPGYLTRRMEKGKMLTEAERIVLEIALVSAGAGL